jgi:hypothetical protein
VIKMKRPIDDLIEEPGNHLTMKPENPLTMDLDKVLEAEVFLSDPTATTAEGIMIQILEIIDDFILKRPIDDLIEEPGNPLTMKPKNPLTMDLDKVLEAGEVFLSDPTATTAKEIMIQILEIIDDLIPDDLEIARIRDEQEIDESAYLESELDLDEIARIKKALNFECEQTSKKLSELSECFKKLLDLKREHDKRICVRESNGVMALVGYIKNMFWPN